MRILVADDHGIVRSGIKLLLERQADLQVVAEASDGVWLGLGRPDGPVLLKVGMSYVDADGALANLEAEDPGWTPGHGRIPLAGCGRYRREWIYGDRGRASPAQQLDRVGLRP